MSYRTSFLFYKKCRNILLQESRRYAGHSKWQNIKHVKQENDAAKSNIFRIIINRMKLAVQETGVADPNNNVKLAQLVDRAKQANMPLATLKNALDKLKNNRQNAKHDIYTVRCPGGAILILHIASANITLTKGEIATKLRKHNSKYEDNTILKMFDCECHITATKDCNADQAMEDAIKINAHDMEEIQEDNQTLFMFKCDFGNSAKFTSQLKSMGYSIVAIEDTCIPQMGVELSESDLNNVNGLKEKLFAVDAIDKIEDNIL